MYIYVCMKICDIPFGENQVGSVLERLSMENMGSSFRNLGGAGSSKLGLQDLGQLRPFSE